MFSVGRFDACFFRTVHVPPLRTIPISPFPQELVAYRGAWAKRIPNAQNPPKCPQRYVSANGPRSQWFAEQCRWRNADVLKPGLSMLGGPAPLSSRWGGPFPWGHARVVAIVVFFLSLHDLETAGRPPALRFFCEIPAWVLSFPTPWLFAYCRIRLSEAGAFPCSVPPLCCNRQSFAVQLPAESAIKRGCQNGTATPCRVFVVNL